MFVIVAEHHSSLKMSELKEILPNFPAGPLDTYRDQASFSWRDLIAIIDGIEGLKLRVRISHLQNYSK